MTGDAARTASEVLGRIPDDYQAQVTVGDQRSGLTRFANSFIHQNVVDEGMDVSLTLVTSDRRVATAGGKVAGDADALDRFVAEAVEAARVVPVREDWPGLTEPVEIPERPPSPPATVEAGPEERAERVAAFVSEGPGLAAAGYCQTTRGEVAYANTAGHRAEGQLAAAVLDGIHRGERSAGSGHAASRNLADIDGAAVGSVAADRARRGADPVDLEPGEYEVVLAPEAVATIVVFLAFYGFNAKAALEGRSFVSLGERQLDPSLTIVDDATDPRATGLGFDAEGTPKARIELVWEGVSASLAYDRRQAAKAGTTSTGHALSTGAGYMGPVPTDLFVQPGGASPGELVADVDRGLYISTFNYVRILDPRTTVATGLTRNGTFLIEGGELTRGVSDLRFTQSFAGALSPGRVLAVGADARFADSELGPTIVHTPSLRLGTWRFTGGAGG